MDDRVDYDEDVFLWSQQQADALRRLAETRPDLPNDLDLDHIAEEIEDVGRSELNTVRSQLTLMIAHLLKVAALDPSAPPVRHWLDEIDNFHVGATARYTPGMRQLVDLQPLWRSASRLARAQLERADDPVPDWPATCPLDLDMLLDPDFRASTAIDAIRTATARPADRS